MLSKLGTLTERERRINPESLYISLCLCPSVSSGFVCTVTNRNSLKKGRKKQSRDKDQNGPTLKRHDEEDEIFLYFCRDWLWPFPNCCFPTKGGHETLKY